MVDVLAIGDLVVEVVQKDIKHVHLTVHPPDGRVRIAAPARTPIDTLRLYAISRLPWIRRQQAAMRSQVRETAREYLDRESHYVWGQRYLLKVVERDAPPAVELKHRELALSVRHGASEFRRGEILARWYRGQVRAAAEPLMARWAETLQVALPRLFVRSMKTKWGSCNPRTATIRLNTELAKKPRECLEYVLLHELVHLLEPTHNENFRKHMDQLLPRWPQVRDELNRAPLAHVGWNS